MIEKIKRLYVDAQLNLLKYSAKIDETVDADELACVRRMYDESYGARQAYSKVLELLGMHSYDIQKFLDDINSGRTNQNEKKM